MIDPRGSFSCSHGPRRWFNPYPDTPEALRLGFVAAYIGVVGTLVVYSNFVSPCNEQLPALRQWAMIGLLATMLFIERFELARDQQPTPRRLAVGLLIARIALVQGVVMLDCTKLAVLLYAVVPFAAFFVLGAGISRLIGFAYWLLVAIRAVASRRHQPAARASMRSPSWSSSRCF